MFVNAGIFIGLDVLINSTLEMATDFIKVAGMRSSAINLIH